jgi:hypothetical protein
LVLLSARGIVFSSEETEKRGTSETVETLSVCSKSLFSRYFISRISILTILMAVGGSPLGSNQRRTRTEERI